jgi:hypothetical protein
MATKYIVFKYEPPAVTGEPSVTWNEIGPYTAASADAAKKAAAVDHGDGTYSSTTAKSWKPLPLKVQPRAVSA